jgi:hypothetical protein
MHISLYEHRRVPVRPVDAGVVAWFRATQSQTIVYFSTSDRRDAVVSDNTLDAQLIASIFLMTGTIEYMFGGKLPT